MSHYAAEREYGSRGGWRGWARGASAQSKLEDVSECGGKPEQGQRPIIHFYLLPRFSLFLEKKRHFVQHLIFFFFFALQDFIPCKPLILQLPITCLQVNPCPVSAPVSSCQGHNRQAGHLCWQSGAALHPSHSPYTVVAHRHLQTRQEGRVSTHPDCHLGWHEDLLACTIVTQILRIDIASQRQCLYTCVVLFPSLVTQKYLRLHNDARYMVMLYHSVAFITVSADRPISRSKLKLLLEKRIYSSVSQFSRQQHAQKSPLGHRDCIEMEMIFSKFQVQLNFPEIAAHSSPREHNTTRQNSIAQHSTSREAGDRTNPLDRRKVEQQG